MVNPRTALNLEPGWVPSEPWAEQGDIVSVAAGAGVNATAYQVLVSREIPAAARVHIESLFIRVVDMAAYDQLYFALRRNGALIHPWTRISGEQVVEDFEVEVGQAFHSGTLEVVAANISGTGQQGAGPDALDIRCIARFKGWLLRERPRLRG